MGDRPFKNLLEELAPGNPWDDTGETEAQYWMRRYLETRQELWSLATQAEKLKKIAIEYASQDILERFKPMFEKLAEIERGI